MNFEIHQFLYQTHDRLHQIHNNNIPIEAPSDYSCNICYRESEDQLSIYFYHFWDYLSNTHYAIDYSGKTLELISNLSDALEANNRDKARLIVNDITRSIRYSQDPGDFQLLRRRILYAAIHTGGFSFSPFDLTNENTTSTNTTTIQRPTPIITPLQEAMNQTQFTALLDALKESLGESNIVRVEPFHGRMDEDPVEWLAAFEKAADANGWPKRRRKVIAAGYLHGAAALWYDNEGSAIDRWEHTDADLSFCKQFVKRFATIAQRSKWYHDFINIKQGPDEKVETYIARFNRLKVKATAEGENLPATYQVNIFLSGLKPNIAASVATKAPANLNEAERHARNAAIGDYYRQGFATKPTADSASKSLESEVENLAKQLQQMTLNYTALATALTAQEPATRKPVPISKNEIICYNCGERGHISKNCLSERVPRTTTNQLRKTNFQNRPVNMMNVEEDDYDELEYEYISEEEEPEQEAYIATRSGRSYPYPGNKTTQKEARIKKSESEREMKILKPKVTKPTPMQIDDFVMPPKVKKPVQKKQQRQPSVIDNVKPYDVSQDILNTPASATLAQMLKYPDQRKRLAEMLKRATQKDANLVESNNQYRTTAMKCHIRIKNNPVVAVLDSGAAVSIITKSLMKKLGLEIQESSKVVVTTANGDKSRALGQIKNLPIVIQTIAVPITLQVIESTEDTLLLGTDWFNKARATLNFDDQTLQIRYMGKVVVIPTNHVKGNEFILQDDEDDFNELIEELEKEEEYEQEDLEEVEANFSEATEGIQEENPACYLSTVEQAKELTDEKEISVGPLNEEEKDQAKQLMNEYEEIFANNISEEGQTTSLTQTSLVEHIIPTGDVMPIRQKAYRMPPDAQEFVKKEIEAMKSKGIIQESSSPWASPIVLVPKNNGKLRMCIDYRKLNKATKKDSYPLPVIDEVLAMLGKAKWFSSIDLASGYWQIKVKEEDREKTAFITKYGIYEFTVMPFGLCNAPATFQRLMDKVLRPYIGRIALVYLDDIVVFSDTFEQHLKDLATIFETLKQAELKLNREKCHFFLQSIKFLGHVISKDGVQPDEDKIIKVKNFPEPKNLRQLRGFLGLASYYRKFIKNFSKIAKPLNQLLKKEERYEWKDAQQEAFETLKECLVTAPILQYPDFDKTFYLYTDASGSGLGAVLSQFDDEGKEHVIAYASRSLTKPEMNYTTTEQECLAVVWAIKHFYQYYGTRPFVLITDHSALKWLKTTELKGRRARWIMDLESFNFEIKHRAGRKHNNADSLSRMEEVSVNLVELIDEPMTEPRWHIYRGWNWPCNVCGEADHHTHDYCIICNEVQELGRKLCICNEDEIEVIDLTKEEDDESIEIIMDLDEEPLINFEPISEPIERLVCITTKHLVRNVKGRAWMYPEHIPQLLVNTPWWEEPLLVQLENSLLDLPIPGGLHKPLTFTC
jgi:hypothetical protein